MTAVAEAKRPGQEASLKGVRPDQLRAILDYLAALPAGSDVSVNDLRTWLDQEDIPPRARGGLFRRASASGLLVQLVISDGRYSVPVRVQSTGASAKRAYVQVYRRVDSS